MAQILRHLGLPTGLGRPKSGAPCRCRRVSRLSLGRSGRRDVLIACGEPCASGPSLVRRHGRFWCPPIPTWGQSCSHPSGDAPDPRCRRGGRRPDKGSSVNAAGFQRRVEMWKRLPVAVGTLIGPRIARAVPLWHCRSGQRFGLFLAANCLPRRCLSRPRVGPRQPRSGKWFPLLGDASAPAELRSLAQLMLRRLWARLVPVGRAVWTAPKSSPSLLAAMRMTNQGREEQHQLEVSAAAPLFGGTSPLDSLGLVGLLIDVEDSFASRGFPVVLSDERALSERRSPFRSVQSLVDYIERLLTEQVT